MPENKNDLLEQWMKQHDPNRESSSSSRVTDPEIVIKGVTPDPSGEEPLSPTRRFAPPLLSGRLAEYLSKQPPRHIHGDGELLSSKDASFEVRDVQTRAAVAMSIILASHITRFASTTLSEASLNFAREQIMRTFSAHDAVRIEVEAYDLLNWFAGVMNDSWAMSTSVTAIRDESRCLENHVAMLERAIADHRDLEMRYYTGTRGEFSTRRISPIKIDAEKYLIAFCYSRKEERKFRLSRILSLSWVDSLSPSCSTSLGELPVSVENDESLPLDFDAPSATSLEASANASTSAQLNTDIHAPSATSLEASANASTSAQLNADIQAPSADDMMLEDEDDLRAITAEGNENNSPQKTGSTASDSASIAVVNVSGSWIPESKVDEYRRTKLAQDAVQATLPGIAAIHEPPKTPSQTEEPQSKPKPKKNTTGFLPGFEY